MGGRDCPRRAAGVLAALLVLGAILAFASRAAASVYWTNPETGAVGRANLDGTGVDQALIGDAKTVFDVDVDAGHVYWTTEDAIGRANLDGTGADRRFITGLSTPEGVAVNGAHVYWSSHTSRTIGRANLDGTGVDPSFIATGPSRPTEVALGDAHVYWPGGDEERFSGIGRARLDGTGIEERFIRTGGRRGAPCSLAADAAHLYWTKNGIGRANLDGTDVEQSFIRGRVGCGIAVDSTHIYWAGNSIGRARLDGTGVNESLVSAPAGEFFNGLAVNNPTFGLGKVEKDTRNGTAKLTVEIPGAGELELRGKEIYTAEMDVLRAGRVKLRVKPNPDARPELNWKGELTVKVAVTYTPDGGTPSAASTGRKTITLIKRR